MVRTWLRLLLVLGVFALWACERAPGAVPTVTRGSEASAVVASPDTAGGDRLAHNAPDPGAGRADDHAALALRVGEASPVGASGTATSGPQGRFAVRYVRQFDWESVKATLSNLDASLAPQDASAAATVDAAGNRQATLMFAPLKATSGYQLTVELMRTSASGVVEVVASGTNGAVTLTPGGNTVTVSLTATAAGEMAVSVPAPSVYRPVVSTYAGGGAGYAEGSAATARFSSPSGLGMNPATGDLFVADTGNQRLRIVNAAGVVATFSGAGVAGFVDGAAATARFNNPRDLVYDPLTARLYVADGDNHAVRIVAADGSVTTLAGNGSPGSNNGVGNGNPVFNGPRALDIDAANGLLYVADSGNHRIRKLTTTGTISTFAGGNAAGFSDGTGTSASFNTPRGVAFDPVSRTLYVADSLNHALRAITAAGVVTTVAGDGTAGWADGAGAAARFNDPRGLYWDPTWRYLYVADSGNNRVRRFDPATGTVVTLAGTGTAGQLDGAPAIATFNAPRAIVKDPAGALFVADQTSAAIRRISPGF